METVGGGGRRWIDAAIALVLVAFVVFPLIAVATAAGAGERRPDPAVALPPLVREPAGAVRDVPVLSPGAEPITADQLRDPNAMEASVRAAAQRALGAGGAGGVVDLATAQDTLSLHARLVGATPEPVYPFDFPPLDAVIDPVLPKGTNGDRAKLVNDLAVRLTVAAAQFPEQFQSGGSVAFALLDRVRAGGCEPQLNLGFLLAADAQANDEHTALELTKASTACPGDPTALWLLGQFQSVRAMPGVFPQSTAQAAALLPLPSQTFERLQQALPGSPAGWAGEADHELRLGYETATPQPFSARVRFRRALALYRRAEALDGKDPGLVLGEARALAGLGQFDEAVDADRRALAGAKDAAVFQVRLVEQLERAHRFGEAADEGGKAAAGPSALPVGSVLFPETSLVDSSPRDPLLAEDGDGPVSIGIERMKAVTIVVGPPPGGAGGAVSDLSFLPVFHNVDGVTVIDRWCRDLSRRRDLVAAGKADAALDGFPDAFTDFRYPTRPCGGEAEDPVVNLKAVASLEATGAGNEKAKEGRSELFRFAGDLGRAADVTDDWVDQDHSALALDRQGEIAFLRKDFGPAAASFAAAAGKVTSALDRAEEQLKQGTALEEDGKLDAALPVLAGADTSASTERDRLEASNKVCDSDSECGDPALRGGYLSYNARLQQADTQLRARRYNDAVTLYEQARAREAILPRDSAVSLIRPEVLENNQALVEVQRGNPAAAVVNADRALAVDPQNPIFLMNRGFAKEKLGKLDEAAKDYTAAIDADPTLFPAANDLGVILAKQDRLDESERVLRQSIAANPRYALARFNLGVVLDKQGASHVLESQGSLAWASHLDSGLRGKSRDLIFDDDTFVTTLDLSKPLPPTWQFATSQRRASVGIAGLVVILMVIRVLRAVAIDQAVGKTQERVLETTREGRLARLARFGSRLTPLLAVIATVALLLLPLVRAGGATFTEELLVTVGVLALVLGYLRVRAAVATRTQTSVRHFTWAPAVLIGVAAGAANLAYAPLPTAVGRGDGEDAPSSLHWWGPGFLGGMAVLLLLLGRGTGVPVIQALGASALVMTSSVLTPVAPCDGAFLGRGFKALLPSLAVLALGILLFLGYL